MRAEIEFEMCAWIHGASVNQAARGNKISGTIIRTNAKLLRRCEIVAGAAIQSCVWMRGRIAECDVEIVPAMSVSAGAGIEAENILGAQCGADAPIHFAERAGFAEKIKSAAGAAHKFGEENCVRWNSQRARVLVD